MILLQNYIEDYSKRADSENIKVKFLGDTTAFKPSMQKGIKDCAERTKNNTGVTFNIALNYGGRAELVKATKEIAEEVKNNNLKIEDINEEVISNKLYTAGEPDPDLLIRTSGEMRLSNFLPWQLVYTEFLFVDKYWPDFNEEDLDNAIIEYQKRTRKFGAN
jgi:undecaprenyl diphosphate synthase